MAQRTLTGDEVTRLVNVLDNGREGVRLIDRSTKYGNPFRMEKDGGDYTREGCIDAYREWWYADEQVGLRQQTEGELTGETLGWWCSPKPCHGAVIVEYRRDRGATDDGNKTQEAKQ